MTSGFLEKLAAACERNRSLLCVGLDPYLDRMAISDIFDFNRAIIDATKDLVCAYKPNVAFYDGLGGKAIEAMERTLEYIPSNIPIIGDSKRGDVQPASIFHAKAMFERWGFDAATINPLGGRDAVQPFLDYSDKGIFVWCRSSNPDAIEFYDLMLTSSPDGTPRALYEWFAIRASVWNEANNVGLVVGATYPEQLARVRELCPDMPILIPGVGAQLGQLEDSVKYGTDDSGHNAIFNASRSILYASRDPGNFDTAAHREAEALRNRINDDLEVQGKGWGELTLTAT